MRLAEIAEFPPEVIGTPAHLIDDASELHDDWFFEVKRVLVTAGASAPEDLVQGIIDVWSSGTAGSRPMPTWSKKT